MLDSKLAGYKWHGEVACPGSAKVIISCQSLNESASSMEMPYQVAYASIVSSLFSCIASVLIVFSYVR